MRILIVYASTEGHTRHIADVIAEDLRAEGHEVVQQDAAEATALPGDFERVILAGSLHVGRFQPALTAFARANHEALNATRSAFIAVSLSAAGVNPQDWEGLEQCLDRFRHETLWTPAAVHQAAGAIRFSQYDFFKRLVMQLIASSRGQKTVTSQDYDLTDYDALKAFVRGFIGGE